MTPDIALAMITVDRRPRENYLDATLGNLARGGVFSSGRFHSLHIADSRGDGVWLAGPLDRIPYGEIQYPVRRLGAVLSGSGAGVPTEPFPGSRSRRVDARGRENRARVAPVSVYLADEPRVACVNAAAALDGALRAGTPWVLFVEDDIDVCGDFLDSVGRWLDEYGDAYYRVFPFGAAYPQVRDAAKRGLHYWEYPVKAFYGTQCFAIRHNDAQSLADHWRTNPKVCGVQSPGAFDLMLSEWHQRRWPSHPYLLASAPSFVQHMGRQSIATNKPATHTFDSWPGALWCYEPGGVRA